MLLGYGLRPSTAAELRSNKFNQFVFASPALLVLLIIKKETSGAVGIKQIKLINCWINLIEKKRDKLME